MTIKQVSADLLNPRGASGGDVLTYVSANARVEWSAPTSDVANACVNANDYSTYSTLTANDYSTFTALDANIYNTYTAINANLGSGNTSIYLSNTLVSNTALIFEAGNGISISANAASHVFTFTASMSNATAQVIPVSGSSNVFTTVKAAANNNMVLVIYNGIVQDVTRYSWNGAEITLSNSEPLSAGANLEIRYFDFFDLPGSASGGGSSYSFQGSVSGYTSGGKTPTLQNTIDKFPFSSDGNATDVGDLTQGRYHLAGQSSSTNGYTSGGRPQVNTIDKFSFSIDSNAIDVGDLIQSRYTAAGQSSDTSGYTSGGSDPTVNTIDKFPFSTDSNATDVGDLTTLTYASAGQSSSISGYISGGGRPSGNYGLTIDKFSFAADGNATDVGDLTQARVYIAGQSSSSSGYTSGGFPTNNIIDKFPFSSDSNATDVGDLTESKYDMSAQSSTVSGYTSGGNFPYPNTIDKFPFSTNANASDVGDLTQARGAAAGQQV